MLLHPVFGNNMKATERCFSLLALNKPWSAATGKMFVELAFIHGKWGAFISRILTTTVTTPGFNYLRKKKEI